MLNWFDDYLRIDTRLKSFNTILLSLKTSSLEIEHRNNLDLHQYWSFVEDGKYQICHHEIKAMAIKNILIHTDSSVASDHRIKVAIQLAQQHQAEISSVYVVPDYFIPTYYEAQISAEIMEQSTKLALEKAQKAEDRHQQIAEKAGMSMNSIIDQGNLISKVGYYARYTDLLVLGQSNSDDPDNLSEALADNVALEGGTPCLVVPYTEPDMAIGQRVLVAWNASRESARALRDSLPILQRAEKVNLLSIGSKSDDDEQDISITNYLGQHGVEAEIHYDPAKTAHPGEAIVDYANAINVDLIVMGAYGHSRLRELVLGGSTRFLLHNMPVPIFISH